MSLDGFGTLRAACVAALAALLVACGGGGGGGGAGGEGGGQQTVTLDVDLGFTGDLEVFHSTTLTPVFTGLQGHTPQCTASGGVIPPGLTVRSDCTLVGTPTQAGTWETVIRLTASGVSNAVDFGFRFEVSGPKTTYPFPAPFLSGVATALEPSFGDWAPRAGDAFTFTLVGALPPGLAFDPATGRISGTPTQTGDWPFTVEAKLVTGAGNLTLPVATSPGAVRTTGLFYPTIGTVWAGAPYATAPVITPAAGPWTYSVDALPAGLALDPATGVISGAPTAVQNAPVPSTITATQAGTGTQFQAVVPFQVQSPVSIQYSAQTVAVGGGVGKLPAVTNLTNGVLGGWTFNYAVAAGSSLPPNVILDPTTGFIVGTPTAPAAPGLIDVTLTRGAVSFHLVVSDNLTVTP